MGILRSGICIYIWHPEVMRFYANLVEKGWKPLEAIVILSSLVKFLGFLKLLRGFPMCDGCREKFY